MTTGTQGEDAVGPALERVVSAGQRVIADRAELMRVDLALQAERLVKRTALAAIGVLLLAGAWVTGVAATVDALAPWMPDLASRLATIAGAHAVLGGLCLAVSAARRRSG